MATWEDALQDALTPQNIAVTVVQAGDRDTLAITLRLALGSAKVWASVVLERVKYGTDAVICGKVLLEVAHDIDRLRMLDLAAHLSEDEVAWLLVADNASKDERFTQPEEYRFGGEIAARVPETQWGVGYFAFHPYWLNLLRDCL